MVETADFENFDTGAENSGLEDLTPDSSSANPVVEKNNAAALVTTGLAEEESGVRSSNPLFSAPVSKLSKLVVSTMFS